MSVPVGVDVRIRSDCENIGGQECPAPGSLTVAVVSRETDGCTQVLHATAVDLGGKGVLLVGPSGAGKSGLALQLLGLGGLLVADDRVVLSRDAGRLEARAPQELAGLIEARGIGVLRVEALARTAVGLCVDLGRASQTRMPQREKITYLGLEIELILGGGVPNLALGLMHLVRGGYAN